MSQNFAGRIVNFWPGAGLILRGRGAFLNRVSADVFTIQFTSHGITMCAEQFYSPLCVFQVLWRESPWFVYYTAGHKKNKKSRKWDSQGGGKFLIFGVIFIYFKEKKERHKILILTFSEIETLILWQFLIFFMASGVLLHRSRILSSRRHTKLEIYMVKSNQKWCQFQLLQHFTV